MRLSAKAEYACTALLELADSYGGPAPLRLKAIADAHGIPQRFLVQILLQLKTAGLVASVRGSAGGYQLARPPVAITLADVVYAVETEFVERPALSENSPAARALHSVWRELQAQEQRLLAQVTLADLALRARESDALTYQI